MISFKCLADFVVIRNIGTDLCTTQKSVPRATQIAQFKLRRHEIKLNINASFFRINSHTTIFPTKSISDQFHIIICDFRLLIETVIKNFFDGPSK